MGKLVERIQTDPLKKLLRKFPVVAVVGARQTGKTTLVRDLLKDKRKYLTFDDTENVQLAEQDADSLVKQARRITLDEVQRAPTVLKAIKKAVDKKRTAGQFIITGSANITMLPKISETLAGRIAFVDMVPFTVFESLSSCRTRPIFTEIIKTRSARKCWALLNDVKPVRIRIDKHIFNGGLPPPFIETDKSVRLEWFKGYIRTYLERDVRDLSRIQRLYEYQKFLSLSALRTAQILNKANIAKDCGTSYTTACHFLDLLLATFQVFFIEPYYENIGKRLIKSPKLMWCDTGLAAHLQGLSTWEDIQRLGRDSFLFENKIAIELRTYLSIYEPLSKLYYWRTSGGCEIDFIIEKTDRLLPVEVKWKNNIKAKDITNVRVFIQDFKHKCPFGLVLYKGENLLKLDDKIFLVPYQYFFQPVT